ncbi:hypothetical protein VZT92_015291 [Zoarces viviparus]|uniref:Uncharacterized protein n=1 Tax=Zoarces viviparus TaxID=48416 RepID=A0AAW1EWA1_ZOAVI
MIFLCTPWIQNTSVQVVFPQRAEVLDQNKGCAVHRFSIVALAVDISSVPVLHNRPSAGSPQCEGFVAVSSNHPAPHIPRHHRCLQEHTMFFLDRDS